MPTATVLLVSTKPFIAARVEEFLDRRFEALFRALGWREHVVAYTGYGSNEFVRVMARVVWSLADARAILERLIGRAAEWMPISALIGDLATPETRATAIASTFSASLELVREGRMELSQAGAFAPLMMRARSAPVEPIEDVEGR